MYHRYSKIDKNRDLTIIIVNWNTRDILKNCLVSISLTKGNLKLKTIVVDNASGDKSAEMVRKLFPEIHLIESGGNIGFGRANNLAIPFADTPFILFLNPDTILKNSTLERMVNFLHDNPTIGAVGCKATDTRGRPQELGIQKFPSPFLEFIKICFQSEQTISLLKYLLPYQPPSQSGVVFKLYGVCLMVRNEVLKHSGSFDERFFMYCEDVDLCYRIVKLGWKIYYLSDVEIVHLGGAASQKIDSNFTILMTLESVAKFIEKKKGERGKLYYQFAVFFGAIFRLIVLTGIYMIACLGIVYPTISIRKAFNKYLAMVKWSLNLQKPTIKK